METNLEKIAALKVTAAQIENNADTALRLALADASIVKKGFMFSMLFDKKNPICVGFDVGNITKHGVLRHVTFIDGQAFFNILATNNLEYSHPTNLVRFNCVKDKLEIAEQIAKCTLQIKEK